MNAKDKAARRAALKEIAIALGRADAEAISGKRTAMKAWSVTIDPEEGTSIIVFAETRGKAKTKAMRETDYDMDFINIRPLRAKWADGYSDMDDIPIEDFLENGWCWFCSECDCPIFKEDIGGYVDGEPVCKECWARVRERRINLVGAKCEKT